MEHYGFLQKNAKHFHPQILRNEEEVINYVWNRSDHKVLRKRTKHECISSIIDDAIRARLSVHTSAWHDQSTVKRDTTEMEQKSFCWIKQKEQLTRLSYFAFLPHTHTVSRQGLPHLQFPNPKAGVYTPARRWESIMNHESWSTTTTTTTTNKHQHQKIAGMGKKKGRKQRLWFIHFDFPLLMAC